jgi:hypothetical protein
MSEPKKTQKEIDEIVVSQANDDSAWDAEIRVHSRRFWRIRPSSIELAARHFVLSALHRLGAQVTSGWGSQDVDLAVINHFGHALTIDVKALTGSTRWRVEDLHPRTNHFIVFVCFVRDLPNPHVPPEVYVLSSTALRNVLVHTHSEEIVLSELGAELNAREAWHQLIAHEPAV